MSIRITEKRLQSSFQLPRVVQAYPALLHVPFLLTPTRLLLGHFVHLLLPPRLTHSGIVWRKEVMDGWHRMAVAFHVMLRQTAANPTNGRAHFSSPSQG